MSEEDARAQLAKKMVVYRMPGLEAVSVRNVVYRSTSHGPLSLDLYVSSQSVAPERKPVTVFVFGFPAFGRQIKDMGSYVSWSRLVAASGMVGVTYTYEDPVADLQSVLHYLHNHAPELGIDETRIALWACSGNVPMALSALMTEGNTAFRCAVLCYGFMFDIGHSAAVAQASALFGFANPSAGQSLDRFPWQLPLFVVRAGKDMPNLNETIDSFVAEALRRNAPLTFVNHATGPHTFDVVDDSDTSREMIRRVLDFLCFHLLGHR